MRGRRYTLTFITDALAPDALGRWTREGTPTEVSVMCSASEPNLTDGETINGKTVQAVAHVAQGDYPTTYDFVRLDGTRIHDGEYEVVRVSGGVRIVRLDLTRRIRRDGTGGRV